MMKLALNPSYDHYDIIDVLRIFFISLPSFFVTF